MRRMRKRLAALFAVARSTLLEGLQQPVTLLLALTCFEMTVLQPLVQLHTFGEPGRLTRDCGMACLLVFGVAVAAFTAGFTLAAEIRDGTAATALAKPVPRPVFLLGKFLGSCAVAAVFAWGQTWATLLAVRTAEAYVETAHRVGFVRDALCGGLSVAVPAVALALAALVNALTRRRFALWFFGATSLLAPLLSLALGFVGRDGAWTGAAGWTWASDARIVPLALLLFALLCVFCALATAFSTRLPTGPALALSFLLLFLGFLTDGESFSGPVGSCVRAAVPDVQNFWLADALADGGRIAPSHVARVGVYAAGYVAFVLSLGLLSFRNKDL